MKNKVVLIVSFLLFSSIAASAALKFRWVMPVNQIGVTDSYALPCEPETINSAAGAVVPLLALGEAGAVYWVSMDKAGTAGDYVVFRDSATANTTSTAFFTYSQASTTGGQKVEFDPPMAFDNGLSVNVSSQTMGVTVCVRQADGGI